MDSVLSTRAPAKINLSLHIRGRRPDGYHELESLVAFAGTGDILHLTSAGALSLVVTGPTAPAAGSGDDNLVLKAARALAERVPGLRLGAFALIKRLPVAAGIGGGSSDAAAALRLLARANGLAPNDPRLHAAAAATGADIPVCLDPRARMMRGVGDRLGPALGLQPLAAVLVNPGVGLETRTVFHRIGLAPGEMRDGAAHDDVSDATGPALVAMLGRLRNDMQPAAAALQPAVAACLDVLRLCPAQRLVRMSGSGATCFALFDDCRAAGHAARLLRDAQPGWWVKPTLLR